MATLDDFMMNFTPSGIAAKVAAKTTEDVVLKKAESPKSQEIVAQEQAKSAAKVQETARKQAEAAPVVDKTAEQLLAEREAFIVSQTSAGTAGQTSSTAQSGLSKGTREELSETSRITPAEAAKNFIKDLDRLDKATDLYYSIGPEEQAITQQLAKIRQDMTTAAQQLVKDVTNNPIQNYIMGTDSFTSYQRLQATNMLQSAMIQNINALSTVRGNVSQYLKMYQDTTVSNLTKGATQGETENLATTGPKTAIGKETLSHYANIIFDMQERGEVPKELPPNFVGTFAEWARTNGGQYNEVFGDGLGNLINKRILSYTADKVKFSDSAYTDLLKEQRGYTPGTPLYEQAGATLAKIEVMYRKQNIVDKQTEYAWNELKPEERYAKLNEFVKDSRDKYADQGIEAAIKDGFFTPVDPMAWANEAAASKLAGFEDGIIAPEILQALEESKGNFSSRNYGNYLRDVSDLVVKNTTATPQRRIMAAQQMATIMTLQNKNFDLSGTSIIPTSNQMEFKLKLRDGGDLNAKLDLTNPGTWLYYWNSVIPKESSSFDSMIQTFPFGL